MPGTVKHPPDTSVTSDLCAHLNQRPGVPRRVGRTFPVSDNFAQGDLSHTRPSRAVLNLTEGDLITGASNRSAIATLIERASGYTVLVHIPGRHCADVLTPALIAAFNALPAGLRRSLTWDCGTEMSDHHQLTAATGMPVFFADPHSPWQRGSNENANGLAPLLPQGH